jgi:hypothetical protein
MAQPLIPAAVPSHEALLLAGWEKRAILEEPRLTEVVALYQELGFEVRQEPIETCGEAGCSDCLKADPERYRTVYTRRR